MKKKQSMIRAAASSPYVVWSVLFIVAPLLFVLWFALTDGNGSFSIENIRGLSAYGRTFVMSIGFSLIATAVCFLIGYPLAYAMARTSRRIRNILTVLIMLPMWTSLLVRTYALMALLDNGGIVSNTLTRMGLLNGHLNFIGTGGAVILGMVYDFLPYMILPIYTSMTKLDIRYVEAAADLGCNGTQTLFRVVLPLTVPGIVSGLTMVFVPSISTFYISQKLGGGSFDLIGDTIERQFQNTVTYNTGAAISLVMMILILISLGVMNHFTDQKSEVIVK